MSQQQNNIITADDIRNYRPVAVNISERERIDPYITEVEQLYIAPAFGAKLYKKLLLRVASKETNIILKESTDENIQDSNGDIITLGTPSDEVMHTLFHGGFYNNDKNYFAGLIAAVAYLTYSRMVRNQSVNVTAFGVVFKNGDFSEKADEATIARLSNESQKIGTQHLNDCIAYLKTIGELPCNTNRVNRAKIRVITK